MDTFLLGNYWDSTVFFLKTIVNMRLQFKLPREKVKDLRMFGA